MIRQTMIYLIVAIVFLMTTKFQPKGIEAKDLGWAYYFGGFGGVLFWGSILILYVFSVEVSSIAWWLGTEFFLFCILYRINFVYRKEYYETKKSRDCNFKTLKILRNVYIGTAVGELLCVLIFVGTLLEWVL